MQQYFRVCDVPAVVETTEHSVAEVLRLAFGGLPAAQLSADPPVLRYAATRNSSPSGLTVARDGFPPLAAASLHELIFLVDKDLTVELQRLRADLFFVHAGVVADEGRAWAISAPSGTGKSTTVWALVCEGLRYVSDELAPIELAASSAWVHPYPRALNLKREPEAPYGVPAGTLRCREGLYVPTQAMPVGPQTDSLPLHGIFFLRRDADYTAPRVKRLTPAEAATHLYANALNPLAHAGMGLDMAISIAERIPCLEVELGPLSASVAAIRHYMNRKAVVD